MTIGPHDTKRKPDCVVIDTNIWRSDLLLKTPMGQSLVYALQRQGGRIGLPEVVEAELIGQMVECGLEAAKKFAESSRIINALTDPPFPTTAPTRSDLEKKVKERLAELESILHRMPFTFEHAKAALNMVIAKLPPNGPGDQQFKDSAIWQAVLTLSRDYSVRLVSNDRAFLSDRSDPLKGFAPNLLEDCRRAEATITVHCDLASCLKAITSNAPSLDQTRLVSLITDSLMSRLQAQAARHRLRIIEPADAKTQVFRTANTSRLAVDYLITAPCASVVTDDRLDCLLIARGSCYYDPEANSISGEFLWSLVIEGKYRYGGTFRMGSGFESEDPSFPFSAPVNWTWGNAVNGIQFRRTEEGCQE